MIYSQPSTTVLPNDYSFGQFMIDVSAGVTYQGTLRFWQTFWPVVLGSVAYLILGPLLLRLFADPGETKRRAWMPSLFSSSLMFLGCAPIFLTWLSYQIPTKGVEYATEELVTSSRTTDYLIVFFLTFLWFDMIVSGLFHPEHMEILAGWVHHIVYICLCSNALYWHWTVGLAIMFVEELPTFLLALGRCYPILVTEKGFGWTFAFLRLGIHAFISILVTIYCRRTSFIWIAAWLAMLVHVWWFAGWLARQQRLMKDARRLSFLPPDDPRRHELMKSIATPDYRLDSVLIEEPANAAISARGEKYRKMSDAGETARLLSKGPASP
eukprot:Blabericola_migrator_1__10252@NODE_573_length_7510_cov_308_719602_g427_i0_p3_GENE_NODE_573_length_7510_cov_308_719602_g427_i0NODE_573_length_7510_cov_308_719602_g427_i0_p3_ORF_typecomplete_len325_score30_64TRAM_LAG1_CLN8/PF03798_16/1_2e03TRAM_LAG1_CLN8/PF03798_16/1_9e05_NODE_573_length_7510_cov_308_719602_g427_i01581132